MSGESFVSWTLTPITTKDAVRKLSGYATQSDIPDGDLDLIIARAQAFVTHELSERIHNLELWGPLDGVNTRYELPPRFHGRVLLNASNSGNEKDDVQVYLRSVAPSNGAPQAFVAATISATDALHGQVVLTTAPDRLTYDKVLFSGFLMRAAVTKDRFQGVVELYAAHLADQRVKGPGKVILSNPKGENDRLLVRGKWFDIYEREVRLLKRTSGRTASIKTRFPGIGATWWNDVGRQTPP